MRPRMIPLPSRRALLVGSLALGAYVGASYGASVLQVDWVGLAPADARQTVCVLAGPLALIHWGPSPWACSSALLAVIAALHAVRARGARGSMLAGAVVWLCSGWFAFIAGT